MLRSADKSSIDTAAVNTPGWAAHMFKNLSTARLLSVVAPAGLEAEFSEIGKQVATRTTQQHKMK